jgi:hypothetical protein
VSLDPLVFRCPSSSPEVVEDGADGPDQPLTRSGARTVAGSCDGACGVGVDDQVLEVAVLVPRAS